VFESPRRWCTRPWTAQIRGGRITDGDNALVGREALEARARLHKGGEASGRRHWAAAIKPSRPVELTGVRRLSPVGASPQAGR
jgi:hypothetical protein